MCVFVNIYYKSIVKYLINPLSHINKACCKNGKDTKSKACAIISL